MSIHQKGHQLFSQTAYLLDNQPIGEINESFSLLTSPKARSKYITSKNEMPAPTTSVLVATIWAIKIVNVAIIIPNIPSVTLKITAPEKSMLSIPSETKPNVVNKAKQMLSNIHIAKWLNTVACLPIDKAFKISVLPSSSSPRVSLAKIVIFIIANMIPVNKIISWVNKTPTLACLKSPGPSIASIAGFSDISIIGVILAGSGYIDSKAGGIINVKPTKITSHNSIFKRFLFK